MLFGIVNIVDINLIMNSINNGIPNFKLSMLAVLLSILVFFNVMDLVDIVHVINIIHSIIASVVKKYLFF